jgi:hypothetical protein
VKFPVSREFDPESGSLKTPSTAMESKLFISPGLQRRSRALPGNFCEFVPTEISAAAGMPPEKEPFL